jgi:integrase/recombinase XerD
MTPLRRRMTQDMQVRNFSPNTQNSYVQQVSLFARHFSKSPEVLGPEEIRSYQVYLTNERKLATSSILIAVSALRFLYKVTLHRDWYLEDVIPAPKKPQKLPIVLSPEEVLHFLSCVQSFKHRTILTVCYAAGLRISEAVRLKVADIDSQRMVIRVEQGKCQKDRYVCLGLFTDHQARRICSNFGDSIHSTAARPPQSGDHCPLSTHRDQQSMFDCQPTRSAPAASSR